MPERIQRKRTKGWRMPPGAVYVGRISQTNRGAWGNPYRVGMFRDYDQADAVADFKKWLAGDIGARVWAGAPPTRKEIRAALAGKDLACWCKPGTPCHADVLLRIANSKR